MAKRNTNDDDQSQENSDNLNDADNFGLPDIEYKPLETEETATETKAESAETTTSSYSSGDSYKSNDSSSSYGSYTYQEEKSNAPMVIGLIIVLVVAVAGFLIYNYVYKPQADKAKKEQLAKEEERKRKEREAREAKAREEEERKRREAEAATPVTQAPGTIETLTERTKRYYVVVSSAVDGDLIMDYAKKLSAKGAALKIIPPFGKWKFYRLAIGDYDSFATAQTNADNAKAEYGDGVWVIKY